MPEHGSAPNRGVTAEGADRGSRRQRATTGSLYLDPSKRGHLSPFLSFVSKKLFEISG